jgi:predicted 2-oxoglutarate/Fe(II)-dependent dioxygenase YbiX
MASITTELAAVLSAVSRPGDFFVSGTIEMLAPRLEVDGVGRVALPLLPMQAEQLVAVAERAPYGRGEDTLVDTDVRRTWQIGADRVRIEGKHWAQTLDAILARIAAGLGVAEPITAELYKLLVYDQGSFFVSHRDTEKVPGMFATLVLVLPSMSTGGELVVRHKGREVRLDLRCEDPSEVAFAAFYADCVHEVLPVTQGCRLTLVYSVLRKGKGPVPRPPSYEGEQAEAAALLQAWVAGKQSSDDDAPEKLIYPLEHAYTPAELSFDTLKGVDAAVAGVLVAAAPRAGCDLHLAQVSIDESGAAEYRADFNPRRGRRSNPEDEFEAGEVFDRHVALSEWRRPDGSRPALGEFPIGDDEISPPDAFEDMEPDNEEFHEAAGNEGASYERSYRRAALVLWPRERILAVLNQAGLPMTLPYLGDLTERWAATGGGRQSPLWRQAHELAGHMLSTWPTERWYPRQDKSPSAAARMLALLTRLHDTERLDAFLSDIIARGLFGTDDSEAVLGALGDLSSDRAAALIERIVAGTAATSFGSCANLLARAAALPPGQPMDLLGAATALIEALPGDPARTTPRDPWQRDVGVQSDVVVDLFAAVVAIDGTLAERAAGHILAWPKTFGLDSVLIPAVRNLTITHKDSAAVKRLRMACVEHLRTRAAEPLEAPRDWRRASEVGCKCPRCAELSAYLGDPGRKSWIFRAAEPDRSHVETTIRNARFDLDVTTDRRGRPYSLVCTKNQASHDRRVQQRNKDLADLKRLEA